MGNKSCLHFKQLQTGTIIAVELSCLKVDIVEQPTVTSQRHVRKRKLRREHAIIEGQVLVHVVTSNISLLVLRFEKLGEC